jgi:hypothetical protein
MHDGDGTKSNHFFVCLRGIEESIKLIGTTYAGCFRSKFARSPQLITRARDNPTTRHVRARPGTRCLSSNNRAYDETMHAPDAPGSRYVSNFLPIA